MIPREARDFPKRVRGISIPPRYLPLGWVAKKLGISPKVAARAAARGQVPAKLLTNGRNPCTGVWVIAAKQLSRGEDLLRDLNPRTSRCTAFAEGMSLGAIADVLGYTIHNVYRKARAHDYPLVWVRAKNAKGPRRVAGLLHQDAAEFIAAMQARQKERERRREMAYE